MTTARLTKNQAEAMDVLAQHAGKTVEVLTSGYTANVAAKAVENSVGTFNASTLRGLAAKGLIRIEATYWKGARITVLEAATDWPAYVSELEDDALVALADAVEDEVAAREDDGPRIRNRAFPAEGFGEALPDGGMRLTMAEREWFGEVLKRVRTVEADAKVPLRQLARSPELGDKGRDMTMTGVGRFLKSEPDVFTHVWRDEPMPLAPPEAPNELRHYVARLVLIAGGLPPAPVRVIFGPDAAGAAAAYTPAFSPRTNDGGRG